jgi:hypothetical protein
VSDAKWVLEQQAAAEPPTLGTSSHRREKPTRSHRRKILLGLLVVVLLGCAVAGIVMYRTATAINTDASAVKTDLEQVRASLAADDLVGAQRAQASARRHAVEAASRAGSWPVAGLRRLPVAGGAARDLDHLVAAAGLVVKSSDQLLTAYEEVSGEGHPLLRDRHVDLARLPALRQRVDAAATSLQAAERELRQVNGDLPGLGWIAAKRDSTLHEVVPARRDLDHAGAVLARLPAALGADGPKRYLLAMSNESELRASGGAPLSLAVLTFDNGTISVGKSVQSEDLPTKLTWQGAPGSPFNDPDGTRTNRFANASVHPDFRTAGQDLMGAAHAAGLPRLDGVVSVDVRAIAEVLRVTGPLPSAAYGEITAGNVGNKLLVEAYARYAQDQNVRQGLNDQLQVALIDRLLDGQAALPVLRALAGSAQGRHVQIYTADRALEDQIATLGAGGVVRADTGDIVGVFSQNGNGSKVDVFQRRTIRVRVTLAADGSAHVTQTVQVSNEVPADRAAVKARSGYLTGWSLNAYYLCLPAGARSPRLSSPTEGFAVVPFNGSTWVDDGYGHRLARMIGKLAPDAHGEIELSYDLPPGTFRGKDGTVTYSLHALTQPLWWPATLDLRVTGAGVASTERVPLDRNLVITASGAS